MDTFTFIVSMKGFMVRNVPEGEAEQVLLQGLEPSLCSLSYKTTSAPKVRHTLHQSVLFSTFQ